MIVPSLLSEIDSRVPSAEPAPTGLVAVTVLSPPNCVMLVRSTFTGPAQLPNVVVGSKLNVPPVGAVMAPVVELNVSAILFVVVTGGGPAGGGGGIRGLAVSSRAAAGPAFAPGFLDT